MTLSFTPSIWHWPSMHAAGAAAQSQATGPAQWAAYCISIERSVVMFASAATGVWQPMRVPSSNVLPHSELSGPRHCSSSLQLRASDQASRYCVQSAAHESPPPSSAFVMSSAAMPSNDSNCSPGVTNPSSEGSKRACTDPIAWTLPGTHVGAQSIP